MKSHSTFLGEGDYYICPSLGGVGNLWGRKSKIIEYIQAAIGEYVRWGSVRHGIPFRTYVGEAEANPIKFCTCTYVGLLLFPIFHAYMQASR